MSTEDFQEATGRWPRGWEVLAEATPGWLSRRRSLGQPVVLRGRGERLVPSEVEGPGTVLSATPEYRSPTLEELLSIERFRLNRMGATPGKPNEA